LVSSLTVIIASPAKAGQVQRVVAYRQYLFIYVEPVRLDSKQIAQRCAIIR
jgi:hypothetical protein